MKRIDKMVFNFEWRSMFPNCSLIHDKLVASDHHPLILFLHSQACSSNRPFIFDLKWITSPYCDRIVEEVQRNENCNGDFIAKMENCKTTLVHWNKLSFENAKKHIRELTSELDALLSSPGNSSTLEEIKCVKSQLKHQWHLGELFWFQKSRVSQLSHVNKNTRFSCFNHATSPKESNCEDTKCKGDLVVG